MVRWRLSPIVRGVVMLLLLWTGIDITNASLCALEQEQETPYAQGHADAALNADSVPPLPIAPQPPHVDDCFCCSHCVEVLALAPAFLPMPVPRDAEPTVLSSPRIFGARLYHPPLA